MLWQQAHQSETRIHAAVRGIFTNLLGVPLVLPGDTYYDLPRVSSETESLHKHCARAINHALRFGLHGLPLMGGGDWNDGTNLVGAHGKGESVRLEFLLYDVLIRFSEQARLRGDSAFADKCLAEAG